MWSTPSSTARRSTCSASPRSRGGPQTRAGELHGAEADATDREITRGSRPWHPPLAWAGLLRAAQRSRRNPPLSGAGRPREPRRAAARPCPRALPSTWTASDAEAYLHRRLAQRCRTARRARTLPAARIPCACAIPPGLRWWHRRWCWPWALSTAGGTAWSDPGRPRACRRCPPVRPGKPGQPGSARAVTGRAGKPAGPALMQPFRPGRRRGGPRLRPQHGSAPGRRTPGIVTSSVVNG